MPEAVYRMLTRLCGLVVDLPVGTNLGLLHRLWMLVSGRLLAPRGAVIPGLDACGLSRGAVRRAWSALVAAEGRWRARTHSGYHAVPVDVTAFWWPRLRACATAHDHAEAGGQRLPLALVAAPAGLHPAGRGGELGGGAGRACACAQVWSDLVAPTAGPEAPVLTVVAIHDPRHPQPLLLASPSPPR